MDDTGANEQWVNEEKQRLLEDIRRRIEDTLLRPDAGPAAVAEFCRRAIRFRFYGVCVHPAFVPVAATELAGTGLTIVSVAGFPLGASRSDIKAREAAQAVKDGAGEIDMVMNIGLFKEHRYAAVEKDIREVVEAAGVPVKVILECGYLSPAEMVAACESALAAGAHFVKTATGFGPAGAKVEDVRLLRSVAGNRCGIKAAGGIRTLEEAVALIEAGADRIGTSRGPDLISWLPPIPPHTA